MTSNVRSSALVIASLLSCDSGLHEIQDKMDDAKPAEAAKGAPTYDGPLTGEGGEGGEAETTGGTETTGDAVSVVVERPKDPPPLMKKKKMKRPDFGSKKDPYMQQKSIEQDLYKMDKKLGDVLKGLDGL